MSETPVERLLADRPPLGPMERLDHEQLVEAQRRYLAEPKRDYMLPSRALFAIMDRVYGPERSLEKFRVLEVVARVPYQAWESIAATSVEHCFEVA